MPLGRSSGGGISTGRPSHQSFGPGHACFAIGMISTSPAEDRSPLKPVIRHPMYDPRGVSLGRVLSCAYGPYTTCH